MREIKINYKHRGGRCCATCCNMFQKFEGDSYRCELKKEFNVINPFSICNKYDIGTLERERKSKGLFADLCRFVHKKFINKTVWLKQGDHPEVLPYPGGNNPVCQACGIPYRLEDGSITHGIIYCDEDYDDTVCPGDIIFRNEDGVLRSEFPPEHASDWVKVSERLPKRSGQFIVSHNGLKYSRVKYFYAPANSFDGLDVIAWRSLPEPYKEKA